MNSEYSSYLLAIILIILVISACIAILAAVRGKKRAAARIKPVTCGNVSVFFDRTGNATIIPYVKDRFGSGKATCDVAFLLMPYKPAILGSYIRASMNGCRDSVPCTSRELLDKLGAYDWVGFSVDKKNISIYYKESYGIIFNTTRRKTDGAYEFNYNGAEKTLPPDTDDETLGTTVLQLLQKCR